MQGTVLIHNAEELQSYSRGEEDRLEAIIKGIAEAGAKARAYQNDNSLLSSCRVLQHLASMFAGASSQMPTQATLTHKAEGSIRARFHAASRQGYARKAAA